MFVPDMRAKNIIVGAFKTPATPTLETLMATLPRGAEMTIICPEHVPKPKGNFKVHMIKGTCLLLFCYVGSIVGQFCASKRLHCSSFC